VFRGGRPGLDGREIKTKTSTTESAEMKNDLNGIREEIIRKAISVLRELGPGVLESAKN
jgi:hypothetical protein